MTPQGRCRFGLFAFDLRTGELRRDGELVKLAPQPSRVLALLLATPGELVLRDELRAHLWGEDTFVDFERGLNFCILQVRTALGDSSDNPRFVQTVPRKGYRFIAPVTSVPPGDLPASARVGFQGELRRGHAEAAREGGRPSQETLTPAGDLRPSVVGTEVALAGRRLPGGTAVALGVAALLILAPVIWLGLGRGTPSAAGDATTTRLRLAVLPFVNLTGDSDAEYLVDGLTDELIAQLGRVSPDRLGVIARTSVLRYRNTEKTVAEIGQELAVSYVVEGSVRREGTRLRVTTDLVKVSDQAQVWSDAFERPAGDSMDLQTDVAVRVARALVLELVPGLAGPALPRPTKNVDAWDAYLRGRYWLNRWGAAEARQSLDQFETAVRLDPGFAAGWAQLAEARHLLVMTGNMAPLDAYPRAREAARRALALDSTLADVHVANGIVQLWFDWQPQDAARSFERALALNPSHAAAHHDYAWSLVGLGRFDEAVAHITAARDLDPLSSRANTDIGWLYLQLRQPTEATRACQHTLAIQPGALEAQACLERAFLQRGLQDEALRAAEASLPSNMDAVLPTRGAATSRERLLAFWRWRLERLEEMARSRWINPHTIAVHLAMLGDTERAVEQLERAYTQRVGAMAFLKTDPALDPLRSHPRFEALLQKITQRSR